jgi:hypothetical protein
VSSLNTFLSKNNIKPIRHEKTVFPDKSEQESPICYVPLSLVTFNSMNNRFRPNEALSNEEQSKLLRQQNPNSFKSLVQSIQNQPCSEAVKLQFIDGQLIVIDGHRRIEASKDAGRTDFLAIVYADLNKERFDFISEWNEENPTKLAHEAFYKARGIAIPILQAKTGAEVDEIFDYLKRRNLKEAQIKRAVSTISYISEFAKTVGEPEEKRADQYKAFETVAHFKETKYSTLHSIGEHEKVDLLQNIATHFLIANIAHNDIKTVLDSLAARNFEDEIWIQILNKEIDLNQTSHLRRLVNEIRLNNSSIDLVAEAKVFTQRVYGKLLSNPDQEVIGNILVEISSFTEKLKMLSNNEAAAQ